MRHRELIERTYREHGHVVLRRARQILGTDDDAREILQELFASLAERPTQLDAARSVVSWIYGATTHLCLSKIRTRSIRARLLEEQHRDASVAHPSSAAAATDLQRILARMPEELAQVAVHYYQDEMTHAEIADVMGCSRRQIGVLIERLHEWVDREEKDKCA